MEIQKQKEITVIKLILLVFVFIISCSQQLKYDSKSEFMKYYFDENFKTDKIINLNKDNSNIKIYQTLLMYSKNESKQDSLINQILNKDELIKIKRQIVKDTEWSSDIANHFKNIRISNLDKETVFITEPIFCRENKYCLIYSYTKNNGVYFIPSIEVFKNKKKGGWSKIGKINHF
jgi:hypothetical protein